MMAPISISEEARRSANLRVLQRMDNEIIDILGNATHVVLYEFNSTAQAWEKRNCEGSLFIVKRSGDPRFHLVVMNRTSKDNLVVPITPKFQKQVREPYFIFANRDDAGQKIRGIWFHDSGEREAISNTLDRIVKSMSTSAKEEQVSNRSMHKKVVSNSQATATLLSALKIDKNHTKTDSKKSSQQTERDDQDDMKLLQSVELDKKALQMSLLSLVQDDRFIDLLHAQYLRVLRARGQGGNSDD